MSGNNIGKGGPNIQPRLLKTPKETAVQGESVEGPKATPDEITVPMRQSPALQGIAVDSKSLEQIASGEQVVANTTTKGGGAQNIAAFFAFGLEGKGAKDVKPFGHDVKMGDASDVTGVVGTFSPSTIASLQTPTIVRSVPWNLERPMALRHPNSTALARGLAQKDDAGKSVFETLARKTLDATSVVPTSAGQMRKADAPLKKKSGESDYYDTPSFQLFNSDYTMATRTKTGFDADGKPTNVELQVLSSSSFDANGIEMKGNAALSHDAPTMEEHGALEQSVLTDNLVWGGEKQTLHPLKHFHDVISEKGELAEGEPLQLQAMMHYRGESLSTTMTRESEPQLRTRLDDSIATLQGEGGPEGVLADRLATFATLAPTSWQGIDAMQESFAALKKDAALSTSPAMTSAMSAAEGLLFAAQERVFVPQSAGKDFKLSMQFSQVVDPGYWQALAPEDKNPSHVVPDDKILWGWLRVSADVSGGFSSHVERMSEARASLDQDRAGLVMRAVADLGLPQTPAGVRTALGTQKRSLLNAVAARNAQEGGHLSAFDAEAIEQLEATLLTAKSAALPPPKDATAEKMLAGAKAVLERHQALSVEIEQQVSTDASTNLEAMGMGGGTFKVMPEEGSKFTEWSPRKDWYVQMMGESAH